MDSRQAGHDSVRRPLLMSPEHDPKLQPSAADSAAAESSAELPHFAPPAPNTDAPAGNAASTTPAASTSSVASATGAATGVARAQEAPPANCEPNVNSS